ncbi:hypothetical protein F4780DRAFT_725273 [Xylariomycetidae sp. FL0641]|nr:hypothetical protein F4780DRAFT_725273 [Xylariomycetidae sp. FL0641]
MLAARGQENLAFNRQNNATVKQHGQGPSARYPKTPLKVPLNDENATHVVGGAKGILNSRARGNENAMTSKGTKAVNKSNFVTPMGPRTRPVLGDKTTNAKAQGAQTGNGKGTAREIEKSQKKTPGTSRVKQKQLQVHAEETDPVSEEEVEYCPPKPKDLPYESDVFPDGVLTFDALKPENMFKGYYNHYFNPVDEHGVSRSDRELEERTKKALEEGDRRIKEEMENLDWSIDGESELGKPGGKKATLPTKDTAKGAIPKPTLTRKAPSTIRSRNAAEALAIDDGTKSLQRKATKPVVPRQPLKKKTTPFSTQALRPNRFQNMQTPSVARRASSGLKGIEANSRTTIGYSKGRATAAALAKGTQKPSKPAPKSAAPRSGTVLSNESGKTITPKRFANQQSEAAAEDQEWRERVPFLSIFNAEDAPNEDDDFDLLAGGLPPSMLDEEDEEDEFELKLAD